MDELILKSYLDKIKEEYKFVNLFKQSSLINKIMIISYFLLAAIFIIMIILGCFIKRILGFTLIPISFLIILSLFAIVSTKESRSTNNQMNNLIEDIENVKSVLKQFDIESNEQIEKLYIRLNCRLNEYKTKTDKKRNSIFKICQISVIPVFLAVFNQFVESNFEVDKIISFCILYIFFLAVFVFVIYAISETYFDMTSKFYKEMEKFLSILKDIEDFDEKTLKKLSESTC